MLTSIEVKSLFKKRGIRFTFCKKNIKTKRPSSKLDFKQLRPYKILEKVLSINYKLKLLKRSRVYPIFYISLFKKVVRITNTNNKEIEPEHKPDVFDIKRILDNKVSSKGKTEYLVK
jgi:hypothetical protein